MATDKDFKVKNGIVTGGNVGIAGVSTGASLHVYTANASRVATFETTSSTTGAIQIKNTGSGAFPPQVLSINDDMAFQTAGAHRVRIMASGHVAINAITNVGIGGGGDFLAVGGSIGFINQLNGLPGVGNSVELVNRSATGGFQFYTNAGAQIPFTIAGTAPTNSLRIDASGNVLIGTTSAFAKFVVIGNALIGNGSPDNSTAPAFAGTYFGFDGASNTAIIQAVNGSTAQLAFHTKQTGAAPVERMRIASNGAVGIGTSSPLRAFDIAGSAGNVNAGIRTSSTASFVSLRMNDSGSEATAVGSALHQMGTTYSPSGPYFADGCTLTAFGVGGLNLATETSVTPIRFFTQSILRAQITAAGVIQDGAGRELGWKNIPPTSNTWVRGGANVITAAATIGTSNIGDVYSVYNDSAVAVTLTASGVTLRLGGTTTTGNRTLLPFGFATIWYQTTTLAVINGNVT